MGENKRNEGKMSFLNIKYYNILLYIVVPLLYAGLSAYISHKPRQKAWTHPDGRKYKFSFLRNESFYRAFFINSAFSFGLATYYLTSFIKNNQPLLLIGIVAFFIMIKIYTNLFHDNRLEPISFFGKKLSEPGHGLRVVLGLIFTVIFIIIINQLLGLREITLVLDPIVVPVN